MLIVRIIEFLFSANHKFDNMMSTEHLDLDHWREDENFREGSFVKNSHNIVNNVRQVNSVVEFVIYCLYR